MTLAAHSPGGCGRPPTSTDRSPLQLAPQALAECVDVAVCLRSASSIGFDRDAEALSTLTQMNEVFSHPVAAGFPISSFTRYGDSLREAFPAPAEARTPEVSSSVQRAVSPGPGVLSFEHLVVIWVDPISVGDASLLDAVRRAVEEAGIKVPVHARSMTGERCQVLGDLAVILGDRPMPLQLLSGDAHASPATRAWAHDLLGRDLQWMWERYAQYLIEGTLQLLAPDCPIDCSRRGSRHRNPGPVPHPRPRPRRRRPGRARGTSTATRVAQEQAVAGAAHGHVEDGAVLQESSSSAPTNGNPQSRPGRNSRSNSRPLAR